MHNRYARFALIESAQRLGYEDIAERLQSDRNYTKALAAIPAQRVSTFRGYVKQVTDPLAPTAFGLASGDEDHVDWLKASLRYIYPVDYAKETYQGSKPFGQPVFVQALRNAFFNSARSFGNTLAAHFTSSDEQHPEEKELPAPMLALVSTALYASIADYEFDVYDAGEFSADAFADVYSENMRVLNHIKVHAPKKYHSLMHRLFREVRGVQSHSKKTTRTSSDPLALLNLDEMDE